MEKYDSETNRWTLVRKMSCPRGGVGVAALGGKIYAVGGHDGSNYLNSVECYDPMSDVYVVVFVYTSNQTCGIVLFCFVAHRWNPVGKISSCRAGAGVAFCDVFIGDVVSSSTRPALQSVCIDI